MKLEDHFELIIRWIESNLEYFDPKQSSNSMDQVVLIKPLSELALISSILHERTGHSKCRDFLSYCWEVCEHGRFISNLFIARPDVLELAGICSSFERCGFPSGKLKDILAKLFRDKIEWAGALPMWRRLAILHSLELLGIKDVPRKPMYGSFIHEQPHPWIISRDLAYSLTHEIFYFSDFGNRPLEFSPQCLEYLTFLIPIWINVFLRQKNFDLVAELLICMQCLAEPAPSFAVEMLTKHQNQDGSFNGPLGAGSDIPFKIEDGGQFANRYHTTLVAALAYSRPMTPAS